MKHLLLTILIFCTFRILSQNLVPNPGFEEYKDIPCLHIQRAEAFEECYADWNLPTETTADIVTTLAKPNCKCHPDKYTQGRQYPRTGKVMTGIKTYGLGGGVPFWHEYLQVKLKVPLTPGKKYYVEYWVLLSVTASKATNNIGAYFSEYEINTNSRNPLILTPQVNASEIIMTKDTAWTRISGVFITDVPAAYLIIGNFYCDDYTSIERISGGGGGGGGFYFIDDVLVREAEENLPLSPAPPESKKCDKEKEPAEDELTNAKLEVGNTINLNNIFFETGKSELLPKSLRELNILVSILKEYPEMEIEIRGHTDNVGMDEYNLKLSFNRAKAVAEFLLDSGINAERIQFLSYGSKYPVESNNTESGRRKNRRVEFKILKK